MFGGNVVTFRCIIHGSSVPYKISIQPDASVEDLKDQIKTKKIAFRAHDASSLMLWKLSFYSWDWDLCFH